MGVYILSRKTELKKIFPKSVNILPEISEISKHKPEENSAFFIDTSCFSEADVKKAVAQIKKACKTASWGTIEPKGKVGDSDKKADNAGPFNTGVKLPPENTFPGWKKMTAGKTMPFYLLYCSLEGKIELDSRLEEKTIVQIHKRFLAVMNSYFQEGEGLFWMDSGKDCLFLFPPKAKCAEAAIKACIQLIVRAPQIVLETFGISIPANFIFALHYGEVTYKPPGKTGTIVSDAVNYVFHLGSKKAESGRLIISGELPEKSIPQALQDCFVCAGEFADRKVWHTKKFDYPRPWV